MWTLSVVEHYLFLFSTVPPIAVMTTPCYVRFLHFCYLSLISESTSLRLMRSTYQEFEGAPFPELGDSLSYSRWQWSLVLTTPPWGPLEIQVTVPAALFPSCYSQPQESLWKLPKLLRLASVPTGIYVAISLETPSPGVSVFSPTCGNHIPPSTFPTLLSHSPLGFLGTKKLPPIIPFW